MAEHYEYQFPEVYEADTFEMWMHGDHAAGRGLAEYLVEVNDSRIPPLDFGGTSVLVRFRRFGSDEPWQSYRVEIRCTVTYEARKEQA